MDLTLINTGLFAKVVVQVDADNYKKLLAKATRIFGLALLAAFLIYFLINVVFAGASLAVAGARAVWERTAALEPPRLRWEPPELVHPFSYEYRGLNCLILVTFVPVFLHLIQAWHSRLPPQKRKS
jgi:hypothetical protein